MSNEESAELTEPGVGALDDPASFVAPEFPAVFMLSLLVVLPVRHDEVDASLGQPFSQRIGVIGAVGDDAFGLLPGTAFGAGDFDFGERGSGLPAAHADSMLRYFSGIRNGKIYAPTFAVKDLLGRPPRSFDDWVRDNADALKG